MMARRRIGGVGVVGVLAVLLSVVAPAFACAPLALLNADVPSGPPGTPVLLRGSGFSPTDGHVAISWGDRMGLLGLLTTVTLTGPTFTVGVTVPDTATPSTEPYFFVAEQHRSGQPSMRTATTFFVSPKPVSTSGYRLVASDGGIFAFGDAGFFGSMGGRPLNRPIVGMASTPSGNGYWEAASDGGIFAFGDAGFFGSMGGRPLASPVVGMARTSSGQGYWLVASDGGIFALGDAPFFGAEAGVPYNQPTVGMAAAPAPALGYWVLGANGVVANHGEFWVAYDEPVVAPLTHPAVGIAPAGGTGHWIASSDGRVVARRSAPLLGSMEGLPLARPIVGLAAHKG